jgi:Kef-type K+ transport system membrane component KefB
MTFGTLTLIVAAGLAGPALAGLRGRAVPAVVGEIAAGVVVGASGFGWIDATDPVLEFLSAIGFAMLMFVVGTRLPLRDARLREALGRAVVATAFAFLCAIGGAVLLSHVTTVHRAGMLVPLLATSSAAVALPIAQERGLASAAALGAIAWIAVADIATMLVIPLVMSSGATARVIAGSLLVTACAFGLWLAARRTRRAPWAHDMRKLSKRRGWALDLRVSLVALFGLSWLALKFGTGVLVAGFSAGAVVALVGEPKRLVQQLLGLAEGFFVPLFFVTLGARLDVRELFQSRSDLWLMATLAAAAVACHVVSAAAVRLPPAAGLLATAQLGVPAAVASLGLANGYLDNGQAAAVMGAALLSLVAAAIGAAVLARAPAATPPGSPRVSG